MKYRIVFYPTLYKDVVIHTPPETKSVHSLHSIRTESGGVDLRPFVLEIKEMS